MKGETMATLVIIIVLIALAVMLLGVKIFFVKGGRFPNTHIHDNAEMKKRGITCARDSEFYK
jgi:fumarate reductase subunit C